MQAEPSHTQQRSGGESAEAGRRAPHPRGARAAPIQANGRAAAELMRAAPPGPIALLFCDGPFLAAASADWAVRRGATLLLACGEEEGVARAIAAADLAGARAQALAAPAYGRAAAAATLETVAGPAAGRWILPLFNGEFPAFPWWESRSLADLAAFQEGERRAGVGGFVADMFAEGLAEAAEAEDPDWAPPPEALFDLGGMFALTGPPERWEAPGAPDARPEAPRLYGGIGWRMQERLKTPPPRLDRTAFFKARADLRFDETFRTGDPAMDGLSGPWHRSPTMAVMSFRAARALYADPDVAAAPPDLAWSGARPWRWSSAELLDAGAMEPGQWF